MQGGTGKVGCLGSIGNGIANVAVQYNFNRFRLKVEAVEGGGARADVLCFSFVFFSRYIGPLGGGVVW